MPGHILLHPLKEGEAVARLMIVDDRPDVIESLRMLVEARSGNHVVGYASGGREALELASRLRPDLVIMDFSMPDMDGIEVARRMRRRDPDVNVLILSVYDDKERRALAEKAGISAWIPKSAPPAVLMHAIERALEERGAEWNEGR